MPALLAALFVQRRRHSGTGQVAAQAPHGVAVEDGALVRAMQDRLDVAEAEKSLALFAEIAAALGKPARALHS